MSRFEGCKPGVSWLSEQVNGQPSEVCHPTDDSKIHRDLMSFRGVVDGHHDRATLTALTRVFSKHHMWRFDRHRLFQSVEVMFEDGVPSFVEGRLFVPLWSWSMESSISSS